MDLFKGLTEEQRELATKELREFAKFKHSHYLQQLNVYPEDPVNTKMAIAWEYICQNLGVKGYEWT